MIQTLRITTVLVVILAGVLFASFVLFGTRTDAKFEQLLNSAGVVEKFESAKAGTNETGQTQISPLVEQAGLFALYLDPPPAPAPRNPGQRITAEATERPRPPTVSAKFKLIGTSFYAARPESSLAFIDEPGKGLRWVRQGSQIGHLIIDEIKDGLIVYKDGQNAMQLSVEPRQPQTSLLEGAASVSASAAARAGPKPVTTPPKRAGTDRARAVPPRTLAPRPPSMPPAEEIGPEEGAALMDLVDKLKALQRGTGSEKTDSQTDPRETAAMMQKLVSDFKNERNGSDSTRRPGDLRKLLPSAQRDPNRRSAPKIARPPAPLRSGPAPKK
ncbi:MAG: hypothetical protein JSU70_20625 [Phycisphaerales bacterium]|nr:MAG: hypothetical protein JSU70_20625 [Phycisphaerales bacterium]